MDKPYRRTQSSQNVLGVQLPAQPEPAPPQDREELILQQLAKLQSDIESQRLEAAAAPKPSLPPSSARSWMAVATVVAALFGGGGIATVIRPSGNPQLDEINATLRRQAADTREIRDYVRDARDKDAARWAVAERALCQLNGDRPFAGNVDCHALDVDAAPLGQSIGWKVRAEWPFAPRPP